MADYPHPPGCCQLSNLHSGTTSPSAGDRGRQLLLRVLSAMERRLQRARIRLQGPLHPAAPAGGPARAAHSRDGSGPEFETGDLVQVLSLEEIRATLDERGFCDGLEFMESMADHCGQTLPVMKRVRLIYDESDRRMLKVKRPRYILEGAICHGRNAYAREGCDRSCFYFWSSRWLRRAP